MKVVAAPIRAEDGCLRRPVTANSADRSQGRQSTSSTGAVDENSSSRTSAPTTLMTGSGSVSIRAGISVCTSIVLRAPMAARALVAGGTAASATTASAARAVRLFMIGASTLGTDCHRHALQHTTSLVVT